MASISSLGVGSGLDLGSLVSGLVEAERAPTENRLAFKERNLTTELSGFGVLRSSLSLFQSSLSGLQSSTAFNAKNISLSSGSLFSTTVENYADIGSYAVEVSALAKSHSLASSAATAFADVNDSIGSGTLTINFGTTTSGPYSFTQDPNKATQTIVVSAANGNTTLSGFRDYVNDNDYDVKASIVNDGSGYRLVFTSKSTGAENSMEITASGDGDGNDNDNAGLSQFAFNTAAQSSLVQTVAAEDASLSINGLQITRDSNTVTGAINGVTLNLLKADTGNPVSVNVTENRSEVTESITGFVQAYNDLVTSIDSLTSYDAETGTGSILIGDFTVRSISSQIRSIIFGSVSGLEGNIQSLVDVGITTNINGTLDIDTTTLQDALINYGSEVEGLFSLQGRPTDADIRYISATSDTRAGNHAINLTALASQGIYSGSSVNSLVVDSNNDSFSVKIDGVTSGVINLTQAVYADGDALAAHIQAQINGDSSLKAEAARVSVVYDTLNNQFDITSTRYGGGSRVEFTSVDPNTANDIGFAVGSGVDGVDVAGNINGLAALGNGQFLTGQSGNGNGLELQVVAGLSGNRGNVSFSRGLAASINDLLDNFLQADGFIAAREDGLNEGLEDIVDQRIKLDQRVSGLEARLIQQFTALDILIAQFNQTSSFLTQQLANLPKPNSIGNRS